MTLKITCPEPAKVEKGNYAIHTPTGRLFFVAKVGSVLHAFSLETFEHRPIGPGLFCFDAGESCNEYQHSGFFGHLEALPAGAKIEITVE